MTASARIERALDDAFARVEGVGGPERLAAAMRYAVFPRGARIRPRLTLAVAHACGEDNVALVDAAAASIELMHCASLPVRRAGIDHGRAHRGADPDPVALGGRTHRHRGGAGLGVRTGRRRRDLSPAEDRRPVRRRGHDRRGGVRQGPGALARARRSAGTGLPGGRRHRRRRLG